MIVFIGEDFESSLLSFEKLDRASPDLWPEQCKFDCLMLLNSTLYVTFTDVFTYEPKLHWLKYTDYYSSFFYVSEWWSKVPCTPLIF